MKQQGDESCCSASGEDGGKPGKVKLSSKERARLKREARRQERKAGSDDEDLAADAPAFKVSALSCQCFSVLCVLLACSEADQDLEAIAGAAVNHVRATAEFSCQMGLAKLNSIVS